MENKMFDELIESMKQTVAFRPSEIEPERVTSYSMDDVKAIRVLQACTIAIEEYASKKLRYGFY